MGGACACACTSFLEGDLREDDGAPGTSFDSRYGEYSYWPTAVDAECAGEAMGMGTAWGTGTGAATG